MSALTSQPAAHPYMEPCPIRTIKCKPGVTLSTQQRGAVQSFLREARHTLHQLKWTCELTPFKHQVSTNYKLF